MTTYASARPRSTLKLGKIGSARFTAHAPRRARTTPARQLDLRDGSTVLVRQIGITDGPLLLDGFARMSAESRQARFLIRKDELTEAEVRYFSDVDHHDHEAIIALSADGRGVGVARFVRAVDDDQAAEVAVTVIDDWQRRGLGAVLLGQLLERALQEDIRRFTALIDDSNTAMLGLLRSLGVQLRVVDREFGATEYSIRIDEAHEPSAFVRPHVKQPVRRRVTSHSPTRAATGT